MTYKEYDELIRSLMESDDNSLYAVKLKLTGMFRHGLLTQDYVTDNAFIGSLLRLGMIDDPVAAQDTINAQREAYIMGRQTGTTRASVHLWAELMRHFNATGGQ